MKLFSAYRTSPKRLSQRSFIAPSKMYAIEKCFVVDRKTTRPFRNACGLAIKHQESVVGARLAWLASQVFPVAFSRAKMLAIAIALAGSKLSAFDASNRHSTPIARGYGASTDLNFRQTAAIAKVISLSNVAPDRFAARITSKVGLILAVIRGKVLGIRATQNQILNSIVASVFAAVMYAFSFDELSPDVLFHHKSIPEFVSLFLWHPNHHSVSRADVVAWPPSSSGSGSNAASTFAEFFHPAIISNKEIDSTNLTHALSSGGVA